MNEFMNERKNLEPRNDIIVEGKTKDSMEVEKKGIRVMVRDCNGMKNFINACESTTGKKINRDRAINLRNKMYLAEHSPIRERVFWVTVDNVPTFVANHFARHHEGINQFHLSHRSDRCGVPDQESNRLTPTHFEFSANAQALINMSRRRLCLQASTATRMVMEMIKDCIREIDIGLANCMLPDCEYRSNVCYELNGCGKHISYSQWIIERDETK